MKAAAIAQIIQKPTTIATRNKMGKIMIESAPKMPKKKVQIVQYSAEPMIGIFCRLSSETFAEPSAFLTEALALSLNFLNIRLSYFILWIASIMMIVFSGTFFQTVYGTRSNAVKSFFSNSSIFIKRKSETAVA